MALVRIRSNCQSIHSRVLNVAKQALADTSDCGLPDCSRIRDGFLFHMDKTAFDNADHTIRFINLL